jgi:hypothetical protein
VKRFALSAALVLAGGLAAAQAPPPSPVHWPAPPAPAPVTELAADELFVIGIDTPAVVLASPPGIVSVTSESGPVKIRAKFTGGGGKVQCRTYADQQVVTVEPVAAGTVEILVVWQSSGAPQTDRRLLRVGGPSPAPPSPPTPPPPADPFAAALQAAYAAEADADKAAEVVQLAALYRVAASSTVNDPALASTADLLARMQAARKAILPDASLVKVRTAIEAELNKTLATPAALDSAERSTVATLFNRVATSLEALR